MFEGLFARTCRRTPARGFTPEYKDEAVKLVINTGRTVSTVARELGLNEAMMAITLRGDRPEKVVFHSDRGTQYASDQITPFAAANGLTRSMG